jgi:hypothetical protein
MSFRENGTGKPNRPNLPIIRLELSSLRVINISGFAAYTFSIDGHTFDVIETDGIATVPFVRPPFIVGWDSLGLL